MLLNWVQCLPCRHWENFLIHFFFSFSCVLLLDDRREIDRTMKNAEKVQIYTCVDADLITPDTENRPATIILNCWIKNEIQFFFLTINTTTTTALTMSRSNIQKHWSHLADIFNSVPILGLLPSIREKKEIPANSTAAANLFRTDSYRHIMHSTKFVENNNLCFRIIELFEKKLQSCNVGKTSATSAHRERHRQSEERY